MIYYKSSILSTESDLMDSAFANHLHEYIRNIKAERAKDRFSESQIRHLFLSFIQTEFDVPTEEISLEHRVLLAKVRKRGYIDALFSDLVLEFKTTLKTASGENVDQLTGYLANLPREQKYIGLLTDGLLFQVYILVDDDKAQKTDDFDLGTAKAEDAYLWLDSYLFSQRNIEPTSADIVRRYGISSPTFQVAYQSLNDMLIRVKHLPGLQVWQEQWRSLLSKVYGSDIGDDSLYLRHTYLSQFARLLAFGALSGRPNDGDTLADIVDGSAFHRHGVNNIGENDFFSWILLDEIRDDAISVLQGLSAELVVYDLSKINEDLLKQLYQNLVDPATRHDLGEYYTPDWLAEVVLQDIDYHHPQSLLDPACGSGTFLFTALRRLAHSGLCGAQLVDFALNNIVGVDVHPLAVTIARVNYLLALTDHIKEAPSARSALFSLPVFMADALLRPVEGRGPSAVHIPVDIRHQEQFEIPVEAATSPSALTDTIEQMHDFARTINNPDQMQGEVAAFGNIVQRLYAATLQDTSIHLWANNLRLLAKLMRDGRNGIWAYILKNVSRPLVLSEQRFDVVAGNPPWLSYRYIQSETYQAEVKSLIRYYKLIESDDVQLFTQMDLSTLFFAHARDRYLKVGGSLAFVMPRSVITGAKQHRLFQAQGFTRVLDLEDVEPLFNVPSCVIVLEEDRVYRGEIPAVKYSGQLDAHEIPLSRAEPMLEVKTTKVQFPDSEVKSPYYEVFLQGATLVPRNLCFVRPEGLSSSPAVETDPEVDRDAKEPWKGIHLSGLVYDDYLYATLLSKHLLPFGYQKLHLVALPAILNDDAKPRMIAQKDFTTQGHIPVFNRWFEPVYRKWDELKKESVSESLPEWLNYRNKLVSQKVTDTVKILHNKSGTHISACVIDTRADQIHVYQKRVNGLVTESTTYAYDARSLDEAHYLCALLNAPCVNNAIKPHQPRGLGGERDIHRRAFEACTIPLFDLDDPDHQELASLSWEAHQRIDELKQMEHEKILRGYITTARKAAREATKEQISAIDEIARRILKL